MNPEHQDGNRIPQLRATTDAGVDNPPLRNLIRAVTAHLQDTFHAEQVKTVLGKLARARDQLATGQIREAAASLLEVAPSWTCVSLRDAAFFTESMWDGLEFGDRVRLLTVAIAVYEAHGEWGQARAIAERIHRLAVDASRQDVAVASLLTIANENAREGQDHVAKANFAEVIRLARQYKLNETQIWGHHNLGSLLWKTGQREQAFLEWDRELQLRRGEDVSHLARALGFLAGKYERFDRARATDLYARLVNLLRGGGTPDVLEMRAEAAYRLAALHVYEGGWAAAHRFANIAIADYALLVHREHRLAWCHQLKALAYQGQRKTRKAGAALRERDRLMMLWGEDADRLRIMLESAMSEPDPEQRSTRLLEAEKAAAAVGPEAQIHWYTCAAIVAAKEGDVETALEYLQQAMIHADALEAWQDKRTLIFLHRTMAQILLDSHRVPEALGYARQAFNLDTGDLAIVVVLATIQLNLGHFTDLEDTLPALRRLGSDGHVHFLFIAALAQVKQGEFSRAAALFDEGLRATSGKSWEEYRNECMDMATGIVDPAQAPVLGPLWQQGQQQGAPRLSSLPARLIPRPALPTDGFYARVVRLCADWVLSSQDKAPAFVQDFLERETRSLKEGHFRDDFQRMAATHFPETRGEESRTFGRSDLLIPNPDNPQKRVRFEFKIWGRNDYAGVVGQLIRYMTDQEEIGVVYMVNENKASLGESYTQVAIRDSANYVVGSVRQSPVRPEVVGFPHYLSSHYTPRGRRVMVYHFIHNVWI